MVKKSIYNRRRFISSSAKYAACITAPMIFTRNSSARTIGASVKLGINVPQSGAYADEGAEQLRAFTLAIKHLNGDGDGGLLNTMSPSSLRGNGILGKKVEYVTGDTQTKTDAAVASARRMIEKDGVLMISGGSSSGVAIGVSKSLL